MKNLIYSIFVILLLATTSCTSINGSVKVFAKCCKALLLTDREKTREEKGKKFESLNTSSLRPVNLWNEKMMIW
ncbi:hypothetical protein [Segetibacter sp.]|jgi:hypothetical protein|uniref:hypothetical protein n=1 Tax=Segetibacter sp. TaxID=2231182 RepID=UPI0026323415|nr:hypothetical protein [Segetibacter sp.]